MQTVQTVVSGATHYQDTKGGSLPNSDSFINLSRARLNSTVHSFVYGYSCGRPVDDVKPCIHDQDPTCGSSSRMSALSRQTTQRPQANNNKVSNARGHCSTDTHQHLGRSKRMCSLGCQGLSGEPLPRSRRSSSGRAHPVFAQAQKVDARSAAGLRLRGSDLNNYILCIPALR
jgi:hypothetical protein